jgi:ParB family transcriptional regulator, chromosome partitioning protein
MAFMILSSRLLSLSEIAGVSPLNPRMQDEADDLEGLKASLLNSGQLEVVLVEQTPAGLLLLSGRRRWRAWRELFAQGKLGADTFSIDALIAEGTDGEKRRLALEANVTHRALHPVTEYEAFAALVPEFSVEEIARDFGVTLRRVRQRLALGSLAPEIRAAWRAGQISAEVAQAFTLAASPEAQAMAFAAIGNDELDCNPRDIRDYLRAEAMTASSPEARFVGAEAYVAAGGRIEEDLFTEEATWRDGAILKKLAGEKLAIEAARVAEEEGWGFIVTDEPSYDCDQDDAAIDADLTEAEQAQLSAAEDAAETDEQDKAARRLEEELRQRAVLRAIPLARRASLGLCAELAPDGTIEFTRGILREETESAPSPAVSSSLAAETARGAEASRASSSKQEKVRNADELRVVMLRAAGAAFQSTIVTRLDIALMVAVAIAVAGDLDVFEHAADDDEPTPHPLVNRLRKEAWNFSDALEMAADAEFGDLTTALGYCLAGRLDGLENFSLDQAEQLARAIGKRAGTLGPSFAQFLDYHAYFAAATKDAALRAIAACESDAAATEARKLKKEPLAERAAIAAKDKAWLPSPLDRWAELAQGAEAPAPDEFLDVDAARAGLAAAHAETAA